MAIMYPISGGFYTYSTRFIDPAWGFAMGWNYCLQWAVVLPLEITVAVSSNPPPLFGPFSFRGFALTATSPSP
jgi:amino acid transporter